MPVACSVKKMKEKILGLINDPEREKTTVNFLNINYNWKFSSKF